MPTSATGTSNNRVTRLAAARRASGFTLLEVMVALSIVGIALVVMLGLAQRSMLVNNRLQQMTRATLLAKQKMAEIENKISSGLDQNKGEFAEPNQTFSFESHIIGLVDIRIPLLHTVTALKLD